MNNEAYRYRCTFRICSLSLIYRDNLSFMGSCYYEHINHSDAICEALMSRILYHASYTGAEVKYENFRIQLDERLISNAKNYTVELSFLATKLWEEMIFSSLFLEEIFTANCRLKCILDIYEVQSIFDTPSIIDEILQERNTHKHEKSFTKRSIIVL